LRAQLRDSNRYVALLVAQTGPLNWLCSAAFGDNARRVQALYGRQLED
jgi:hypothetical protein